MEANFTLPTGIQRGFLNRRVQPELPPGYTWEIQKAKYCPKHLPELLGTQRDRLDSPFGFVFCHRGLYERSMRIPENSKMAIEHGTCQGLILHEIDMRSLNITDGGESSDRLVHWFAAHDEASTRVSSQRGTWSTKGFVEIMEMNLVERRFNIEKEDFGSSCTETEAQVPLFFGLVSRASECMQAGGCIQFDFRGKDLVRAVNQFSRMRWLRERMLLKGYNLDYNTIQNFEESYRWARLLPPFNDKNLNTTPSRAPYKDGQMAGNVTFPKCPYIIMVFFPEPMVQNMLKDIAIGSDSDETLDPSTVPFEDMCRSFEAQVLGFVQRADLKLIPEIVHSGLGLGYDKQTGAAVNPLNGDAITENEVILESRIDRAMIEVNLKIKKDFPELYSSSCTRLCEVQLPNGDEYNASIVHGGLYRKPQGERGISSKLRGIHGGLYPQSDLVVADDPFAEIAARTWIDEHKRLDRRQLLHMPYWKWVRQGGEETLKAVEALNGPFLPNMWEGTLEDESHARDAQSPASNVDDECNIGDDNNDGQNGTQGHNDGSDIRPDNGEISDGKGNDGASPEMSEFSRLVMDLYHRSEGSNSVYDGAKRQRRKVVTWSHPDRESDTESFIIEGDGDM